MGRYVYLIYRCTVVVCLEKDDNVPRIEGMLLCLFFVVDIFIARKSRFVSSYIFELLVRLEI